MALVTSLRDYQNVPQVSDPLRNSLRLQKRVPRAHPREVLLFDVRYALPPCSSAREEEEQQGGGYCRM